MTPQDLKTIRGNMTVAEFAEAVGATSAQVRNYEKGELPIPEIVRKAVKALAGESGAEPIPQPDPETQKALVAVTKRAVTLMNKAFYGDPSAIYGEPMADCLKRKPLYATTSAEAFAMRAALEARDKLARRDVPLIPLKPISIKLGNRPINAAIPNPVDHDPPQWAGWRGVLTQNGDVYDYETAHQMRQMSGF